jgi:hypothetical protein
MAELDPDIYEAVLGFCATGDELAESGDHREAIRTYNQAWRLVPEPRSAWNASTWILAAIADAAYLGGFLNTARDALDEVMGCPDAIGNPFLHLRRGEVLFEQREEDAAADELMRAYMGGGPELFDDEPAKYLDFLRTRADIP